MADPSNTTSSTPQSPEDILLARTVIKNGLAPGSRVQAAIAEHSRLRREGSDMALSRVLVARGILRPDICAQLVQRIKEHLATVQQAGPTTAATPVAAPPPAPTPAPPAPAPPAAAATPDQTSELAVPTDYEELKAVEEEAPAQSGNADFEVVEDETPAESGPGDFEVVEDETPAQSGNADWEVVEEDSAPAQSGNADWEVVEEDSAPGATGPKEVLNFDEEVKPGDRKERTGLVRMFDLDTVSQFEFGPYQVLNEIAHGGMGVIYVAREIASNQVFALKVMHNLDISDQELKRFINEAMLAQKIEHPGIVKIHDFGVVEDVPYITMELLEGTPLSHMLNKGVRSRADMLKLLADVAEAADHAHQHGVIHRDLKPANIIICETRAVITDFGLAKEKESDFHLTADGSKVGTPFFLSPEQVHGDSDVDGRVDVWALGVILYQELTGRLPFIGNSLYKLYHAIDSQAPTPPREIDANIPQDLEDICLKALVKDREQRYLDAGTMATDLRSHLAGEEIHVELPAEGAGAVGSRTRDLLLAAAGIGAGALLCLGILKLIGALK